jgi:hypothetical protein
MIRLTILKAFKSGMFVKRAFARNFKLSSDIIEARKALAALM